MPDWIQLCAVILQVAETIQILEYYLPIKDHKEVLCHHKNHPAKESTEIHVLQDHQLNNFHKQKVLSLHKMTLDFISSSSMNFVSLFKLN